MRDALDKLLSGELAILDFRFQPEADQPLFFEPEAHQPFFLAEAEPIFD